MAAPSEVNANNGVPAHQRILRHMGRGRLIDAMTGQNVVIIPKNPEVSRRVEAMPRLFFDDHKNRVRFDPFSGEVWVSSFIDNDEVVTSPKGVMEKAGRGDAKVIVQLWSKSDDISMAIRRERRIAAKLGKEGDVVLGTKKLIATLFELIPQYEEGIVTSDSLPGIQEEMGRVVLESGYGNVRKQNKLVAAERAIRAVQPDPRGFVNPLIARTVAAGSIKLLVAELINAKLGREKHEWILARLTAENELERFIFEEGIKVLEAIENLPSGHKEFVSEVLAARDFFTRFLKPSIIKAAPYRIPAVMARVNLFGMRGKEEETFTQRVLKDDEDFQRFRTQVRIDVMARDLDTLKSNDKETVARHIKNRIVESIDYLKIGLEVGADRLEGNHSEFQGKGGGSTRKPTRSEVFWERVGKEPSDSEML